MKQNVALLEGWVGGGAYELRARGGVRLVCTEQVRRERCGCCLSPHSSANTEVPVAAAAPLLRIKSRHEAVACFTRGPCTCRSGLVVEIHRVDGLGCHLVHCMTLLLMVGLGVKVVLEVLVLLLYVVQLLLLHRVRRLRNIRASPAHCPLRRNERSA